MGMVANPLGMPLMGIALQLFRIHPVYGAKWYLRHIRIKVVRMALGSGPLNEPLWHA